jgi:hypothetical protein
VFGYLVPSDLAAADDDVLILPRRRRSKNFFLSFNLFAERRAESNKKAQKKIQIKQSVIGGEQ